MPTLGGPTIDVFGQVYSYVFMKQRWSDPWLWQPYAQPRGYIYSSAPQISRADILYHFGYINQPDRLTSLPYPLFVPYNAGPWYVLIATQRPGFPVDFHWGGILAEDELTIDRPTVPSGKQELTAFGFEHVLDRCFITKSHVFQNSQEGVIEQVLPFNERHERGGGIFGNESTSLDSNNVFRFYDPTDTTQPFKWNALEIADYLVTYFANKLPDGTDSPVQFELAGQMDALADVEDVYDFRPRDKPFSVWQALNQLIDRRRGLGFVLRSSLQPGAPVYIWIYTLVEAPITAGGKTLPANGEQIYFSIPYVHPYDNLVGEIPFRYSATNLFDSIEVQGEPILVTGSFRKRQGTLTFGWTDALQNAYQAAEDDEARANDRFRSVFSYFVVPPDWDWYALGPLGDANNVLLTANDDGTVSTDRNTDVVGYNYSKQFERNLPLLEGYDYTQVPPVNENPDTYPPEYCKLVVLLPLESQTPPAAFGLLDKFYFAEKGNETEDDMPSCSVRALDHTFGVEIRASPNYLIAMNHFEPDAGMEGDEDPIVDYDDIIVTASVYSDVRTRVLLDGIAIPSPELKPRLVVTLPDCHYWYVSPGTEYDLDPDLPGIPRMVDPGNAVIRDDTDRLRQVAAYLRWWFSRQRQAVTIPIKLPGKYADPGMLLTQINTAWTREPINAVITSRRVNFDMGTTELTTSYLELDSLISLLDDPQRRTRNTWGVKSGRR